MAKAKVALTAKQVQKLIAKAGGNRELARRAGVSPGSVSKWRHHGVSAEYASLLQRSAERVPKAKPRRTAQRRELGESSYDNLQQLLHEAGAQRDAYKAKAEHLERQLTELDRAPKVTLESILTVYRDINRAPDFDEAAGLADDFDYDINEIYDAYYEED